MTKQPHPRVVWLDLARTGALVAMASYHVVFDIELLLPGSGPDPFNGFWGALPPIIASTFLWIAGLSAVLVGARSSRRGRYLRRLALLAGSALTVSVVTAIALPERWVRFGILHLMFTCAIFTPVLRRAPSYLLAALTAFLPVGALLLQDVRGSWFLLPAGARPTGLHMVDYWPIAPWGAAFVAGMLAGRAIVSLRARHLHEAAAQRSDTALRRRLARLAAPGRHSLLVYLVHQPVLIAFLMVVLLGSGNRPQWP